MSYPGGYAHRFDWLLEMHKARAYGSLPHLWNTAPRLITVAKWNALYFALCDYASGEHPPSPPPHSFYHDGV